MEEKETKSTGGKRAAPGGGSKKAAIIAGVVLAILLAAYLGLCAYASGSKLLPNTTVSGVSLGGMSVEEASQVLSQQLGERLSTLTVDFSCGGQTYSVPGSEFAIPADAAAQVAQAQAGPFPVRGAKLLSALLGQAGGAVPVTLDHTPEAVTQAVADHSDTDTQTTWTLSGDALVFTKGRSGRSVDASALMTALEERAGHLLNNDESAGYAPVEAVITQAAPPELDLDRVHGQIYAQVADAYLDPETKEIVPSVIGRDFDVEEARSALADTAEGGTCRFPLTLTQPALSTEELADKLFKDVLGEAVSKITGSSVRIKNVKVTADFVNGNIVLPGEEFSYAKVCTPFTVENGYGRATAYVNGLSKSTVAGGACQCSSTLYWAGLKANLEMVERHPHGYEPSYVPGGLDATVYGDYGESGSLDFRFKNNTDYPIKLEAYADAKNYLHVTIYGTNTTGIHGEPYSTNRVVTRYAQTKYEANPSIPAGTTQKDPERTAYNAVSIDTYQKLVDADGNVLETTKLYRTNYRARDAVIYYNPADTALWGIDPATGLQTQAPAESGLPAESGVPAESGAPTESGVPAESGAPVPPPEATQPVTPPVEPTPPAEGGEPPVLTPPPAVEPTPALPADPNDPLLPPEA